MLLMCFGRTKIPVATDNKPPFTCSIHFPGSERKKEQRKSRRDDDGASHWVAAWASTVASCDSDAETGKRQDV